MSAYRLLLALCACILLVSSASGQKRPEWEKQAQAAQRAQQQAQAQQRAQQQAAQRAQQQAKAQQQAAQRAQQQAQKQQAQNQQRAQRQQQAQQQRQVQQQRLQQQRASQQQAQRRLAFAPKWQGQKINSHERSQNRLRTRTVSGKAKTSRQEGRRPSSRSVPRGIGDKQTSRRWGTNLRFNYRSHGKISEAKRLKRHGIEKGSFAKHHLIPMELKDLPAIRNSSFNIRGGRNIMLLPTPGHAGGKFGARAVHSGSHPVYTRAVQERLIQIGRNGAANNWTRSQYDKAIQRLAVDLKSGLKMPDGGVLKVERNAEGKLK